MDNVKQYLEKLLQGKTVAILGFGREGKSSYHTIRRHFPEAPLIIADRNPHCKALFETEFGIDPKVQFYCGNGYLEPLPQCDVILKSPGISFKELEPTPYAGKVLSQTSIFLDLFKKQVVGVTGTKGKSTTVSLLKHIFHTAGRKVLLGGNIGVAPFELMDQVTGDTVVVFEMSSHQLENITTSPGLSILLNIYQEHLDHYASYRHYQLAKYNIARWQQPDDILIYNASSEVVTGLVKEFHPAGHVYAIGGDITKDNGVKCIDGNLHLRHEQKDILLSELCARTKLPGRHNLANVMAAALAAYIKGVSSEYIAMGVESFRGLPHRLEYIGERKGVTYYNDSISTIPEATIEALKSFPDTHTLLLGGFDRGVDYTLLVEYLMKHPVPCVLFIGKAGARMRDEFLKRSENKAQKLLWFDRFNSAVEKAFELTPSGALCLLSPAAASYDMFKNFEERGENFRQMVLEGKNTPA